MNAPLLVFASICVVAISFMVFFFVALCRAGWRAETCVVERVGWGPESDPDGFRRPIDSMDPDEGTVPLGEPCPADRVRAAATHYVARVDQKIAC